MHFIFFLLGPSLDMLVRPDPKRSNESPLYGSMENPLPVLEAVYGVYGMHANGTVQVWIDDPSEMEYLRVSLKVHVIIVSTLCVFS